MAASAEPADVLQAPSGAQGGGAAAATLAAVPLLLAARCDPVSGRSNTCLLTPKNVNGIHHCCPFLGRVNSLHILHFCAFLCVF